MKDRVITMAAEFLAAGIDPRRPVLFVQSHVPEHTELTWLLSTVTPYGELSRMTQFKEKSEKEPDNINAGILNYPMLMAADVLLYRARAFPSASIRCSTSSWRARSADASTPLRRDVPEPQPLHTTALKILGLDGKAEDVEVARQQRCSSPTSRTSFAPRSMNAFTDPKRLKKADPGHPEECYVCSLQGLCRDAGRDAQYHEDCRTATCGCIDSKRALAENIITTLTPLREKAAEWKAHPERIRQVLGDGAQTARVIAHDTMEKVRAALGLYE